MNTVIKFDKVVLTRELNDKVNMVGEVYEVANITNDVIVLRDVVSKVALGAVSFDDFEKHFTKKDEVSGWTPWTPVGDVEGKLIGYYRTNQKKVQVKTADGYRSEACCNIGEDDFNLSFGINLAFLRCEAKMLRAKKKACEEEFKSYNRELKETQKYIKNMINSLEQQNK